LIANCAVGTWHIRAFVDVDVAEFSGVASEADTFKKWRFLQGGFDMTVGAPNLGVILGHFGLF